MKANLFPILFATVSYFMFPGHASAQSPITTDSMSVYWEQLDGPAGYVTKYAEFGGKMFAATQSALYSSSDNGQNWKFNKALGRQNLEVLFADNDVLLAIEAHKVGDEFNTFVRAVNVWRSADGGASWSNVLSIPILRNATAGIDFSISDIAATSDSKFGFVFRDGQDFTFYESVDNGLTWGEAPTANVQIPVITGFDGAYSGLWRVPASSTAVGFVSNSSAFNDFQNIPIPQLLQTKIVCAAQCGGAFRLFLNDNRMLYTTDTGGSWQEESFVVEDSIRKVELTGTQFFLLTKAGIWRGNLQAPIGLTKIYNGEFGASKLARIISPTPSGYWVNTDFGQTICLPAGQAEWKLRTAGLAGRVERLGAKCGQIYAQCAAYYPDNQTSLLLSNAQDGEWEQLFSTEVSWDVEFGMPLGEWGGFLWAYSPPRLQRSHDCGATWDTMYNLVLGAAASNIVGQGNRMYVYCNSDYTIHYTDDFGGSWVSIPLPSFQSVGKLIVQGDTLIAVPQGFYFSTLDYSIDAGQSWESIAITIPDQSSLQSIFSEGTKLIGTTRQSESSPMAKVFVSTDLGHNWTLTYSTSNRYATQGGLAGGRTHFPYYYDGMLLMHSNNHLHLSSDEGLHWTKLLDLPFTNQLSLTDPGYFWIGYQPQGDTLVQGATLYFANDGYLYAATEAQGIWRTELAPLRDHALVAGGKYGLLQGRLYRDEDNSCDYNTALGDFPLGHKPLTVQPGNISAVTDANGKYSIALPPGNYTLSTVAPAYHVPSCGIPQTHAIGAGITSSADLAFQPVPGIKDLCVLFTAPVRARPGFLVNYKVQVNNVGTTIVSGATLTVDFDAQWLEAISVLPFGQFSATQAIVPLPDMAPGEALVITLNFGVSVNTPLGTDLLFVALCEVGDDAHPANNRAASTQTVTGSFDPNDKTAQPVQAQLPFQPRTFDYLIRFQNTGTDTAFTVIVTDTLDARFDLMSLRNVEASHPFEFRLQPGHVAKWIFRNILLPDSNTNEVASHGYIRFQLETLPDALPGTAIANDADIFFDFNSPVRTNESLAENPKWVVLYQAEAQICEGDTWNGSIWEESANLSDTIQAAWSDTITVTQVIVWPTWNIARDTSISSGQLLFGQQVWQDTTFLFQYQTEEGCDSTVVWTVEALTSGTNLVQGLDFSFEISPNPATQEAWLQFSGFFPSGNTDFSVRIFDGAGHVWNTGAYSATKIVNGLKINIEPWPGGVYFVSLSGQTFKAVKRLVKI